MSKAADKSAGTLTVDQMAALLGATSEELRDLSRRNLIPKIEADRLPQVRTVRAYCGQLRDPVVTTTEAGARMGVTGQTVRDLIGAGYIQRVPGGVRMEASYQGLLRWRADADRRTSKSAAESRVRDARARAIDLRTAREEGELIPTDEAVAYTQVVLGALMSRMSGLPAQITRDLDERRRIEAMLDRIRAEVAAVCAEHGPTYRALPDVDPADGEDGVE